MPPCLLNLPIEEAIKGELEKLFLDKVIAKLGLCVSVYDIKSIEGGFIFPSDGAATYTQRFHAKFDFFDSIHPKRGNMSGRGAVLTWAPLSPCELSSPKEFYWAAGYRRRINTTFIALIPKKPGSVEIKDFWPISVVTGLYKIVAKMLANRLKTVLGKVVTAPQNAFIQSVFVWYQAVSGFKVNLGKSELVLVGSITDVEELVGVLGCKVAELPMTHLGLP
uniref:RNA polymerase Rpb7-like N-terminal domain-containing protein n=1 Tax=Fagus sylvatica TaxID=28930 RepID=A0A2N9FS76_FAGSY